MFFFLNWWLNELLSLLVWNNFVIMVIERKCKFLDLMILRGIFSVLSHSPSLSNNLVLKHYCVDASLLQQQLSILFVCSRGFIAVYYKIQPTFFFLTVCFAVSCISQFLFYTVCFSQDPIQLNRLLFLFLSGLLVFSFLCLSVSEIPFLRCY